MKSRRSSPVARTVWVSLMSPSPTSSSSWPPPSRTVGLDAYRALLASRPGLRATDDAVNRRIAPERILVLAFGRAILMQYAHPLIAAAVAQHSYFTASTADKTKRFRRTMTLRMQLTFGDERTVWEAGQQIDAIHGFIHGEADVPGRGRVRYSARDPHLIKWVHATVVDSTLCVYERFVGRLSQAERDDYMLKASTFAPLLGAGREPVFEDEAALRSYMRSMDASGELTVTDDARRLAARVLEGLPVPVVGPIANGLGRMLIAELLPGWARAGYNMPSTVIGRSMLRASEEIYQHLRPRLPSRLVLWERSYGQSGDGDDKPACPFTGRSSRRMAKSSP